MEPPKNLSSSITSSSSSNSNNITSMPIDLKELLSKLEFIAMIQRGHKININSMSFVSSTSLMGSIVRTLNNENRDNSLLFINNTVDATLEAIDKYNNTQFHKILMHSLSSARNGIDQLATTYREDPEVVSKIKVCIKNIDIQLYNYQLSQSSSINFTKENFVPITDSVPFNFIPPPNTPSSTPNPNSIPNSTDDSLFTKANHLKDITKKIKDNKNSKESKNSNKKLPNMDCY